MVRSLLKPRQAILSNQEKNILEQRSELRNELGALQT